MSGRRLFAIVPAAGRSRRMRQPKLLLPWQGETMMDAVLRAWCGSQVARVVVVLRRDDPQLAAVCQKWPVEMVQPECEPGDMKESIQVGLRHLATAHQPTHHDAWLVAPADLPGLRSELIDRLIAAGGAVDRVVAPRFGGRQGHPVMLPWDLADDVFAVPENAGLDRVLARQRIHFIDFPARCRPVDVDTPEEYAQLDRQLDST
jgi:molybdenum cofactor cytidylyltransferase